MAEAMNLVNFCRIFRLKYTIYHGEHGKFVKIPYGLSTWRKSDVAVNKIVQAD